ncbi:cupin domain-containing protein [Jeotgalibacillus sp. R-1-5s-1]|uniref:cupin domain-containing protein n=1 Tax=Jeotgalibacillus sp. R-1-5s-1 TaxID=2555897 RepID=UPI00106B1714|nr:cupin domain-containing protein [Jeotgalibacillus sp. R-1-5s-1]TFD99921.1 cupin domain-containing protein [Jeotgalibacillus sp. R-1-5s-1]
MYSQNDMYQYPYQSNSMNEGSFYHYPSLPIPNPPLSDQGPNPFTININQATLQNTAFRRALWTGSRLQVTLMCLNPGEDIGIEMHSDVDQFLRIEQGQGIVMMGKSKDQLDFRRMVMDDSAILIPAGTWHNLVNTGSIPLKLYSIYAPPNHPRGTVHQTKADAEAAHHEPDSVFGKTPDEWVMHTSYLVKEGLEDVRKGVNALHILQEFILMGVLVGKGYTPENAYKTVEDWERTGKSKLLQQSKKL